MSVTKNSRDLHANPVKGTERKYTSTKGDKELVYSINIINKNMGTDD